MSEFIAWDYWRWDEHGKYRYDLDYEAPTGLDIRFEDFDADYAEWISRFYWNAPQAAAVSFGRDPDKLPWGDHHGDYLLESERLRKNIFDLKEIIEEDQAKGLLPAEFFPIEMYLQWANRKKIDYPGFLWKLLDERMTPPRQAAEIANDASDEATTEEARLKSKSLEFGKLTSQQQRAENNTLKILYALIKDRDGPSLAKRIESELNKLAEDDPSFKVSLDTIENRLRAARDLRN